MRSALFILTLAALAVLHPACADGRLSPRPDALPQEVSGEVAGPGDAAPEATPADSHADLPPEVDVSRDQLQPAEVDTADSQPVHDVAEEVDLPGPHFDGPCDFASLENMVGGKPVEGYYPVGGFNLFLGGAGTLTAVHSTAPDRVLFATAPTAEFLTAAESDFEVKEHQGSFDVTFEAVRTCAAPKFKKLLSVEGRLVLRGSFQDPPEECGDVTFEVRFCEPQPGHLQWQYAVSEPDLNVLGLAVDSTSHERIFGLGEQFPHNTLDLKGRVIPVLAQEGGVGRGHPVISPVMNTASAGSAGNEGTSYYAAPILLTSRIRALLLENTEYAEFDFTSPLQSRIRLVAPQMTGRVLHGSTPLEMVERITEFTGRMPPLPDWVGEGAVVALARPLPESETYVDQLLAHGAEIAAVWNQTWSGVAKTVIGEQVLWNWVQNEHHHPTWQSFVDTMEGEGIRVLCYVNSMFRDPPEEVGPVPRNLYAEALENGYFIKDKYGLPYLMPVTAFEVGLLDLTHPDGWEWMKDVIKDEMVTNARCSGWMADFAEALPFDAKLHSGEDGAAFHNRYPVEWARLNREVAEELDMVGELLIFNRSGHTRTPQYSLLLWEGDQLTTWDKYDGLRSALFGLVGSGFSGISLNHSDTGGYTSLSQWGLGYKREAALLRRWTEMNAFTAVLRTHEGNQPGANAQVYSDDDSMAHFARMTKVYKALHFYRKTLFAEAWEKGWPVVRHLLFHYPDEEKAWQVHDQFLLGSEILVAPILSKCSGWPDCVDYRAVELPPGEWVHLWTGAEVGQAGAWAYELIDAPMGEPPVFYRKDSPVGDQLVTNLQDAGVL